MSKTAASVSDDNACSDWKFEQECALRIYEAVNTSMACGQSIRLLRDVSGINDTTVDPLNYCDPTHFAEDYMVAGLLTKSLNIPGYDGSYRRNDALTRFLECERKNRETNDRLWGEPLPDWFSDFSYRLGRLLGDLDSGVLEEILDLSGFGPGTNVGLAGRSLVGSIKFDSKPTYTKEAAPLMAAVIPINVWHQWGINPGDHALCNVVPGNKQFTVPKSYKTERCAAKEPLWNSYIQMGIGRYLRNRLKRFGVDLQTQETNQFLASKAQEWRLATLDLSSASDNMAKTMVLLATTYLGSESGKRWFHLLDRTRSHYMRHEGQDICLEMFASMGNGFTFALETCIFLSVLHTVVPRSEWFLCIAYGDDIICPQKYALEVIERLEFLGFQVNRSKTHLAGVFFESCGTDWFKGQNVRPFFLRKDPLKGAIPYEVQVHNALRAWCIRVYGDVPERYKKVLRWLKGRLPRFWRMPVPPEFGDSGLHTSLDEALKSDTVKRACSAPVLMTRVLFPNGSSKYGGRVVMPVYTDQWEGYRVKHVHLAPVKVDRCTYGVVLQTLSHETGQGDSATYGMEPKRGFLGIPRLTESVTLWKGDL